MDVMRKLHSLLTPVNEAANRSYTGTLRPATQNQGSFAETLREATGRPENSPEVILPTVISSLTPEAPGATEKGEEPSTDLPVAEIHIDARDTLAEIIVAEQEKFEVEAPIDLDGSLDIPVSIVPDDVVIGAEEPVAGKDGSGSVPPASESANPVTPPIAEPPSTRKSLPPVGVPWTSLVIRGTGVSNDHGVNGTDGAWLKQLEFKHDQYTNPGKYNATLNTEARMFLDAVDRGYVSNTPEGLGTLLGYLSKGSVGPDAKPPAIAAYFNQFFANLNSMNV